MGATVAFYTLGDTRRSHGGAVQFPGQTEAAVPTMTDLYRQRAMSLASDPSHVFGVPTRADAIARLNALPPHSVSAIYFVGHGTAGGYFFSGHPDAEEGFTAPLNCLVQAPVPQNFAAVLERVLDSSGHVEISFMSCFTGSGTTGRDFMDSLEGALPANLPHYTVGMFEDYYQTGYTTDRQGRFQAWRDQVVSGDASHTLIEEAPYAGAGVPQYQRFRSTEALADDLSAVE